MNEFCIGDKVVCLGNHHYDAPSRCPRANVSGKIVNIDYGPVYVSQHYLVQWEKGSTSKDDLWWAYDDDIIVYKEKAYPMITIESDGKRTTACLFKYGVRVKMASSCCDPNDKFNLFFGADLALKRLFDKEESEDER
jgi:hypothetical protein